MDYITYTAIRVTCDSVHDYATTRHRFDEQIPLLDQTVALNLVADNASWSQVEAEVGRRTGPSGLVALSLPSPKAMTAPSESTVKLSGPQRPRP